MLSEEALILFAATGACVLLVLGILELVAPTLARHPRRRRAPARDPWRRARTGAPIAPPVREDKAAVVVAPSDVGTVGAEPPIERLLMSEAASIAAPAMAPPARQSASWARRRPEVGPVPEPRLEPPSAPEPDPRDVAPAAASQLSPAVEPRAQPARAPVVGTPPPPAPPAHEWIEVGPASEKDAAAEPSPSVAIQPRLEAADASASEPAGAEPAAAEPEPPAGRSPADRCYALYESRQFREVLAEAVPLLESASSGAVFLSPQDAARLRGVIGLSRQALGDHDGARAAFEEAIVVAPEWDRATWQRHLAALALHVGQQLLVQAHNGSADAEERVTTLHSAIMWLDGGLAAAPDDPSLREAAVSARAALWPTYEQVTSELVQRQEHHVARRLLRQALADEDCPPRVQSAFREMLSATYGGEVGQLTAEAIRRMQEGKEEEALATLDRAEGVLATIPEEGLADKRRQELERRLWWSYTKVGMRRLDGGMYEEALGPLLHALHFASVGPERLDESKRPLARALESIVEARSPLIQRLATEGDKDGALVLCEKLWTFLRNAMERGMSKEELSSAFNRTQALFEKLGKPGR